LLRRVIKASSFTGRTVREKLLGFGQLPPNVEANKLGLGGRSFEPEGPAGPAGPAPPPCAAILLLLRMTVKKEGRRVTISGSISTGLKPRKLLIE